MSLIYSNPRKLAVIKDWPMGRLQKATAVFEVEYKHGKGERCTRVTVGDKKALTYAVKVRIVDGSDGKTYIAEKTKYGSISIMRGDMKHQEEYINDRDARYADVLSFFTEI